MRVVYSIINLLLVPIIVLYIRSIRKKERQKISFDLLGQYIFAVSINIVIARTLGIILQNYTGKIVYADRASYTACALVTAILQPILFEAVQVFSKFAIMDKESGQQEEPEK